MLTCPTCLVPNTFPCLVWKRFCDPHFPCLEYLHAWRASCHTCLHAIRALRLVSHLASLLPEVSRMPHVFLTSYVNFNFCALREKCPNTGFFLLRIHANTDLKKLRIWALFTQWYCYVPTPHVTFFYLSLTR